MLYVENDTIITKDIVPLLTPGGSTDAEVWVWLSILFHCSFSEILPHDTVVIIVFVIYQAAVKG